MATTNTNFYYNTTINGSATAGALSCSSLTNTGTLSSTSAATMGALSCSSVSSLGAINSSGAFSCGSNAATVGALSCSTIATSSGIVCDALTASGQIVGGSITSSGALTCSTIANSSGLVCGALTSSGSILTYGQFSRVTSSGGIYNPPIESTYIYAPGLLELRGQEDFGHGVGLLLNSSCGGVNRRWRTTCYGADGSYRIRDDTPGIGADRMTITPSGTVLNMKFGDTITIYKDLVCSYDLASSSDPETVYGSFGHVATPTDYFTDSSANDLILRNSGGNRLLLGVGGGHSTVQINSSALGVVNAGNGVYLTSNGYPTEQGLWLSWNNGGGDGNSYIINQRGLGQGGISMGSYDSSGKSYHQHLFIHSSGRLWLPNIINDTGNAGSYGLKWNNSTKEVTYDSNIITSSAGVGIGSNVTLNTGGFGVVIGTNVTNNGYEAIAIGRGLTNGQSELVFGRDGAATYCAYGSTTWSSVSDLRAKDEILDLHLGINFINKIRPVSFKWKPEYDVQNDGKKHHGFIAQEIKQVMDEMNEPDFEGYANRGGNLTVAPTAFIPSMIKAIQELSRELNQLKSVLNIP